MLKKFKMCYRGEIVRVFKKEFEAETLEEATELKDEFIENGGEWKLESERDGSYGNWFLDEVKKGV